MDKIQDKAATNSHYSVDSMATSIEYPIRNFSSEESMLSPPSRHTWEEMTTLEWIEQLASTTQEQEVAQGHGDCIEPLTIDGIDLSIKAPPLPPIPTIQQDETLEGVCNSKSDLMDFENTKRQKRLVNEYFHDERGTVEPELPLSTPPIKQGSILGEKLIKKEGLSERQIIDNVMTDWLRKNWINPYPDDDGIAELAVTCNTTPDKISNWLINSRTRKWRPAMYEAYDLGRPCHLLLEDSINIFDGKPVREVEGIRTIKSPPLSSRGKKRKRGKS